jgi:hypothetical protein
MSAYFIAVFILTILSISEKTIIGQRQDKEALALHSRTQQAVWGVALVILSLMIGLRHEVGADWGPYLYMFEQIAGSPEFQRGELLYQIVNVFAAWNGGDIYLVNLICAFISLGFLIRAFAKWEGDVLFGLICAFPYFIVVMLMGYTRQGVAACIALYAIAYIRTNRYLNFIFFIVLAAQFHSSAMLLLPLVFFNKEYSAMMLLKLIGLGLLTGALYFGFIGDQIDLTSEVIDSSYAQLYVYEVWAVSQGIFHRIALIVLSFILFLVYRKSFLIKYKDNRIFRNIFYLFAGLVTLLFLGFPTTPVDRMLLYILPLTLVIQARVPAVIGKRAHAYWTALACLVVIDLLQIYFWMTYAYHSSHWQPYQNWLFL